jgi:hypothetical protein
VARDNDQRGGACDAIRDQGRPDRWAGERERERERGEADGGSRQLTGKRVMGDVDRVCESGPIGKE